MGKSGTASALWIVSSNNLNRKTAMNTFKTLNDLLIVWGIIDIYPEYSPAFEYNSQRNVKLTDGTNIDISRDSEGFYHVD